MIAKSDKYHFLLAGEYQTNASRNGEYVNNSKKRFLGIKCVSQVTLTSNTSNLCKKNPTKQKKQARSYSISLNS